MLLDPFEEQFHLPARLVERADGGCRQREVIGDKDQRLAGFRILESDETQMFEIVLAAVDTRTAMPWRSGSPRSKCATSITSPRRAPSAAPTWHIIASEVPPNVSSHLIVIATLEMGSAILIEARALLPRPGGAAAAALLGPEISEAKGYMFFSPWLITISALALLALVLAIKLLGDGVRDVAAPGRPRLSASVAGEVT